MKKTLHYQFRERRMDLPRRFLRVQVFASMMLK